MRNEHVHPAFRGLLNAISTGIPECERCAEFDEIHDQNCPTHPDYDPTPWCSGCGARKRSDCHCGPIADND